MHILRNLILLVGDQFTKPNSRKNHSLKVFGIKDELQTNAVCDNVTIKNSKEPKVLKITFDNNLTSLPKI